MWVPGRCMESGLHKQQLWLWISPSDTTGPGCSTSTTAILFTPSAQFPTPVICSWSQCSDNQLVLELEAPTLSSMSYHADTGLLCDCCFPEHCTWAISFHSDGSHIFTTILWTRNLGFRQRHIWVIQLVNCLRYVCEHLVTVVMLLCCVILLLGDRVFALTWLRSGDQLLGPSSPRYPSKEWPLWVPPVYCESLSCKIFLVSCQGFRKITAEPLFAKSLRNPWALLDPLPLIKRQHQRLL